MQLPSELEAALVIPALRAMLARELLSSGGMNQSEVGSLLGITQSAVSNYVTGTRAKVNHYLEVPAVRSRVSEIAGLAESSRDSTQVAIGLAGLTRFIRVNRLMCEMHRSVEPGLDILNCHVCDV